MQAPASRTLCRCVINAAFLIVLLLAAAPHVLAQQQPPSAPTVSATAGKAKVTVSWGAVGNASSYLIYKSGSSYPAASSTGTSWVDTSVRNGGTYSGLISSTTALCRSSNSTRPARLPQRTRSGRRGWCRGATLPAPSTSSTRRGV